MADPYRLRVLKALTCHLEGISPELGYDYELKGAVYRGRTVVGEDMKVPALSILESPRPDFGAYVGEDQARSEGWALLLQGWVEDDKKNPTDPAYRLASAVENRLALIVLERDDGSGRPLDTLAYMLGRQEDGHTLISKFQFGPPVVRPPDQSSSKAFFYMTLRVGLAVAFG